ncbi:hypothetical protein F5Y00DRAFT_251833 [Daldinia vernicosa]|uniref:uncharacterized protein n=1 Tax=Daldinia vernicosa TaxID=114800 RepID=UPI0020074827|nr:uncharacterized protein F5Y00DRAFT_251833 [Daldinia vernicosa]KAI0851215.1 hypothetical protein F5Y00DRAFT_251833 [Daldinia vernicosa]
MSTPGSYRPPLPPRNPQPPGYTNTSLGYPNGGYPPPPPGLPPRNPAYVPSSRPPPVPPRPPGYEIITPTSSNEQFPPRFSIPPPPPGPPPGIVRPASANHPSYPYHYPEAKETVKIPPLVHTTATRTPDIRPLEKNPSSSSTPQPFNTPISSLSPGQLPSPVAPTTSPSSEYLEAQFRSLSVENRPSTNLPLISHHTSQPLQSPVACSTPPVATFPDPHVPKSDGHIYELPTENELKGRPAAPSAVTSCIDDPVTFATDWYWHPNAPGFLICSRCYVDYIHGTRFWDLFRRERFSDSKPRVCCFNKPRMRNHLFKDALATGSLEPALAWMHSRSQIPDCKGIEGVKGKVGIKWYMVKLNNIPGFVSCEACYEDRILTNHFFVNFEPTQPQPAEDTWSCDLAVPFIEKEYEAKGKGNDWAGFVSETKARMSIKPCPQRNLELTYGRKWFVPKHGPEGLVLCSGCYCDRVIHTGEEALWEIDEKLTKAYDTKVRCSLGVFSIRMAMARAHDINDFQVFWRSVHKLANEKFCDDDGIEDGIWYSLPSNPPNFGICAGCYVAIAEPLDISRFFVPKRDAQPAGMKWQCCFSLAHPRFRQFMPRLLEMYHTHDPTSFDKFASVYCSIPVCPRDEDAQNKYWYGWTDCTICPECYHDFAQQSPLAAKMELNNTLLETSTMCEMYSPRMRDLYIKCSEASPPDARELLTCSVQRRLVWIQTVPQMRMMIFRAKLALNQQRFLNVTSSHYNQVGMLQDITYGHTHTYGAAGVGYGYANGNLLQGAVYAQQAAQAGASAASGSAVLLVRQLEQQWRAVE